MKNVILFIVDSVRYYSTGGKDDRDKLSMMDRFAEESIYFPLTVTSAPSSVMSLSTMLTSLPSYYIARNYDDFRYDNDQFISLHNILRDNGYDTRSLFNARELRFLFGDVIKHVDKKYWPKGINNNQVNWSNSVMNEILEKFLDSETFKRPLFFIAWYNVRLDPNTSLLIEEGINILKRNNVWDNSIFLLASDHGYMDPNRGYTPEKLEKMGLSHDLLLTDDNIRIPFYLRYPGSPVKKIEQPVSTLDFLPTILSLLDIKAPQTKTYQMKGKDLTSLINGNSNSIEEFTSRKVRCDARFFAQADRATAIRGANYKYIARPDRNVEEFYDLDKDSWERNNIINDINYQNIVEEYRSEYIKSEKEIIDFQFKYLLSKLDKSLKDKLQSFISAESLGEQVELLGNRGDVLRIISSFDLFIMTSLWEGFSIALLEAMATGLPIIATNVGGNPEVIENLDSGIIVSPGDTDGIVKAIIMLINDDDLRQKIGNNARTKFMSKFSSAIMVEKLDNLYTHY